MPDPEITEAAEREAAEQVEQAGDGWHIGTPWMGRTKYECNSCSFDSMRLDLIEEHVGMHKPKQRLTSVLGPDGERIVTEEPATKPERPQPPEEVHAAGTDVGQTGSAQSPEEGEST